MRIILQIFCFDPPISSPFCQLLKFEITMDQEMDQKILIAVYNCHMQSPPSVPWIKPIKIQVACPLLPTPIWEDLLPQ